MNLPQNPPAIFIYRISSKGLRCAYGGQMHVRTSQLFLKRLHQPNQDFVFAVDRNTVQVIIQVALFGKADFVKFLFFVNGYIQFKVAFRVRKRG